MQERCLSNRLPAALSTTKKEGRKQSRRPGNSAKSIEQSKKRTARKPDGPAYKNKNCLIGIEML
jgi:hypothetical protein